MQQINQLNHEELIKLTEDQLQHFVDIEIAYAGIKLVNPVHLKEVPIVNIKPTEEYWRVHEQLYRTQEEALTVASIPTFRADYDYGAGYDYKYPCLTETAPMKVMLYKKEDIDAVRRVLIQIKEAKEYNERIQKEYDKYLKSIDGCRNDVYQIYCEAMSKENSISLCVADYNKYVELAAGNKEIAMNFFEKAYEDEPEDIKKMALLRIIPAVSESINEA